MANGQNLSGECLTSKKAQLALNQYLHSHPSPRDEIEKRTGAVQGIEDEAAQEVSMGEDCDDDADIPSSAIIRDALGITVSGADLNVSHCVNHAQNVNEHQGLVAMGEEEDIWAWNKGEKWGDVLPTTEDDD